MPGSLSPVGVLPEGKRISQVFAGVALFTKQDYRKVSLSGFVFWLNKKSAMLWWSNWKEGLLGGTASFEVAQCCWSRAAEARGSSLQVSLCASWCCIHWQTCLKTAAWRYQACFSLGANSYIPMGFHWTRLCLYLSVSNSMGHLQATSARSTSALLCFWLRIAFVRENTGHF